MSHHILCIAADPAVRRLLTEAAQAAGAEPLGAASLGQTLARAKEAQLAIAVGEEGLETLERLALDRPQILRLIVLDTGSREGLLSAIERAHPWVVIPHPLERNRLRSAIHDALGDVGSDGNETTRRSSLPAIAHPDFARLTSDRLTGAHNYHYLRLRLGQEIERSARYGRPLALLLADVDDLRVLNDRYGRACGDLALQIAAGALLAGARSIDLVGRWAGGALALVLPETGGGAAFGIAERLRSDVAVRRLSRPQSLRVTICCGVAAMHQEGKPHPDSLVARADAALWRAKQGGKNRSIVDT